MTGCWDYREVESLFIVSGIAVDQGTQKKYRLTFEILDLSGGSENGGAKSMLLSAEGDTIADAVSHAVQTSKNDLYFSDCKLIVFSREIAENGLSPVLDWLNRDPGPRFTMLLFVSLQPTAGELLKQEDGGSPICYRISETMELASASGLSPSVALYQADNILLGEGKDLLLPCLQKSSQSVAPAAPQISGCAVFRGDRCVSYLNDDQTQTDLLVTSSSTGGILLTGKDDRSVSLKVLKSSTDIRPQLSGADPAMEVAVTAECAFDEENTEDNLFLQIGGEGIQQLAEQTIEKNVSEEIARIQTGCGCDIYGFGRTIYQQAPARWQELRPRWQELFRAMKVSVTADVSIINSGFASPKGHT